MIYEVKMYAGKCDNCGAEAMEGSDFSCLNDESSVKDEMNNSGWEEHEGKDYCTYCWSRDDDDKIMIDANRTKVVAKKSRCCGRCDGVNDICVSDMICEKHTTQGCEICYGKRN